MGVRMMCDLWSRDPLWGNPQSRLCMMHLKQSSSNTLQDHPKRHYAVVRVLTYGRPFIRCRTVQQAQPKCQSAIVQVCIIRWMIPTPTPTITITTKSIPNNQCDRPVFSHCCTFIALDPAQHKDKHWKLTKI